MTQLTTEVETITKVTYSDGVVTLEVRGHSQHPTRYTVIVGPKGREHNARLELSEENWAALLELIQVAKNAVDVS
jgi:diadenosine tetraphosphate (Ap4A) HIT family hydrolase